MILYRVTMPEAPPSVGSAIVAQSVGRNNDPVVPGRKYILFRYRKASKGLLSAEVFGQYFNNTHGINGLHMYVLQLFPRSQH